MMFEQVLRNILMLTVLGVLYILSRYRYKQNQKYAKEYANDRRKILNRLIITNAVKALSTAAIFGIMINKLDIFLVLYVVTPCIIAITYLFFYKEDWIQGFLTFVKGAYYLGLAIVSVIQYFLKTVDIATLALGFTTSLAVFECTSAMTDGYYKMRKTRNKCE